MSQHLHVYTCYSIELNIRERVSNEKDMKSELFWKKRRLLFAKVSIFLLTVRGNITLSNSDLSAIHLKYP